MREVPAPDISFADPGYSPLDALKAISRCEVMPTFLRNWRRLVLKTSSFTTACATLLSRMVQHVFAEIALRAVGARDGIAAERVAILAARHVFG